MKERKVVIILRTWIVQTDMTQIKFYQETVKMCRQTKRRENKQGYN